MKHETELKVQALLDGELPESEQREIARLLETDSEAAKLFESLASTKKIIASHEPEFKLPESGDFFWSKIRREIQSQPAQNRPVPTATWELRKWWRLLVPAGMVALAAIVILPQLSQRSIAYRPHEVESPLREMSAITFHSESANMTVVWVQNQWD